MHLDILNKMCGLTDGMMRTSTAALIAVWLSGITATAQTNEDMKWALGEVAGELQECSVYFGFVEYCIAAQRPDIARTYHAAKERLNELALKSHLAAGLSGDAYIAMLPLHAQNMRELLGNRETLGNNCSNIAVLLKKYMNFCQRLSQDADPRLKEWIACIRARQQTCGGPGLP